MKVLFTQAAWEDYLFWQENDATIIGKINILVKEAMRTPFTGLANQSHWSEI